MELIKYAIIIALVCAFIITLLYKWGVTEYVQVHGNDFFSKMFACNFCLSWWTAIIISIAVYAVTKDAQVLFVPFLSTPITRYIL